MCSCKIGECQPTSSNKDIWASLVWSCDQNVPGNIGVPSPAGCTYGKTVKMSSKDQVAWLNLRPGFVTSWCRASRSEQKNYPKITDNPVVFLVPLIGLLPGGPLQRKSGYENEWMTPSWIIICLIVVWLRRCWLIVIFSFFSLIVFFFGFECCLILLCHFELECSSVSFLFSDGPFIYSFPFLECFSDLLCSITNAHILLDKYGQEFSRVSGWVYDW